MNDVTMMNDRMISTACVLLLAVSVLLGCTREGSQTAAVRDEQTFMTAGDLLTKGNGSITTESLRTRSFGLFAWDCYDDEWFLSYSPSSLVLDNAMAAYTGTSGGYDYWRCTPPTYWLPGRSVSFFAYAPYMDCGGPMLSFPLSESGTTPRGTFTQAQAVGDQVDFCLAPPVYDRTKAGGPVQLQFSHMLTKVLFYFNVGGGAVNDGTHFYRLLSLTVTGVAGTNSFTHGPVEPAWDAIPSGDVSLRTATYVLSAGDGTLTAGALPFESDRSAQEGLARFDCVNGQEEGVLYMLPQVLAPVSEVSMTFGRFHLEGDVPVQDEVYEPITSLLPRQVPWRRGETVIYSTSFDPTSLLTTLKFDVSIAPWGNNTISDITFPVS